MCEFCCNENAVNPFTVSNGIIVDGDYPEAPPGFTVSGPISGNPYIDGLLYNTTQIRSPIGQGADLTYSYQSNVNANAQAGIEAWLNVWSDVADLTFTQGSGGTDMVFSVEPLGGGVRGRAQLPPGDMIWLNSSIDSNLTSQGPLWSSIGHEIGHSLGLSHTFGGALDLTPLGMHDADYSIMAYSSADSASHLIDRTEYHNAVGYADIQAIQYIYGANTTYNVDNTTYDFSTQIIGAIWDAGGNDVFVATGDTNGAKIDLRDIGPSDTASLDAANTIMNSRVYIAKDAVIEHAIGGSSNDLIIGNTVANELYGNGGADTIYGGSGGDVIFGGSGFSDPTDGADKIYAGSNNDLVIGNAGNDEIYGDGGPGGVPSTAPGHDTIYGGEGNDFLNGEQGNDLIVAGPGQDSLYGGADNDAFVFANDVSGGVSIVYDFQGAGASGGDVIRILAGANGASNVSTAQAVIESIVSDGIHSYIPVVGANGGYGILVAWTQGLTADDIQVVGADTLLSPATTLA